MPRLARILDDPGERIWGIYFKGHLRIMIVFMPRTLKVELVPRPQPQTRPKLVLIKGGLSS